MTARFEKKKKLRAKMSNDSETTRLNMYLAQNKMLETILKLKTCPNINSYSNLLIKLGSLPKNSPISITVG